MDRLSPSHPTAHYPIYFETQPQHMPIYNPAMDPSLGYDLGHHTLMTPTGRVMIPANSHAGITPMSNEYSMPLDASLLHHMVSPTEHLHPHPIMHNLRSHRPPRTNRPPISRGHTVQGPTRPLPLHRQASFPVNAPARSASPHLIAGDLFAPAPGSPIRRPSTAIGVLGHNQVDSSAVQVFHAIGQGISPARALGPPQAQHFSPPPQNVMITPFHHKTALMPSSASSSTAASSSSSYESVHSHELLESHESPTRTYVTRQKQMHDRPLRSTAPPLNRPQRPLPKPMAGGRTSAKFAQVAEDPGVEGIPPGPRPMDRPSPSFACIIGQAILKSSAGGLSLEHIYRYVETAYPFFKSGDGAWRNSVRHNLSIHKMFETIPRTEKFPPGKGGIWIIHEDEKCHWPEENKFIKNFPASHPHHGLCRQTLHERAKEKDAMDRAAREGREYVPKKGKKGRKFASNDEESMDMVRTASESEFAPPATPPPVTDADDADFLPENIDLHPVVSGPAIKEKRKLLDDDNVFHPTKRVRMPAPQAVLDDTFITPERERPLSNAKIMSSAFKTPALVATSSSPGSSPLPLTMPRTTHHPSALQQAWTHDELAQENSPQPMLDTAFDLQPKNAKGRTRTLVIEDDYPVASNNPPKTPLTRSSAGREMKTPGMIIKTPLTFGKSPAQAPPTISALLSTPLWEVGGCIERLKDYGSSPTSIRSPLPPTSPTRYAMLRGDTSHMREFSL